MSKIDLTSSEWCELIFQDRNHAYGAFKMRSESRKRHTWAMASVVLLAGVACCIPTLIKLAAPDKADEKIVEVAVLSQLEEAEVKQEEFKKVDPITPPPALKSSIKFTAPVIRKDEEVSEVDEIKCGSPFRGTLPRSSHTGGWRDRALPRQGSRDGGHGGSWHRG